MLTKGEKLLDVLKSQTRSLQLGEKSQLRCLRKDMPFGDTADRKR